MNLNPSWEPQCMIFMLLWELLQSQSESQLWTNKYLSNTAHLPGYNQG